MRTLFLAGLPAVAVSVSSGNARSGVKLTPVDKVITLLKNLQADTEAQGKKEAAQYDKYACFCKEQADGKLYAIEKSDKKIGSLKAQIESLDAEINELNGEIKQLGSDIQSVESDLRGVAEDMAKEQAAYLVQDADIQGAISALERAIKAVKDSKGALSGAKVDFAQIQAIAAQVRSLVTDRPRKNSLSLFEQKPAGYEYQSNEILQTLEDLLDTFLANKKEKDEDHFRLRSANEKRELNFQNMKKFMLKEMAEKQQLSDDKSATRAAAEDERQEEINMRDADQNFMNVLTEECEKKAGQWDQRVKCRADELTAIAGALETLNDKVKPSHSANKKLAQTFFQLKSDSSKERAIRKVSGILSKAAKHIDSPALAQLAVRVDASEDHFVKVRALINDLIAKLEDDADKEADQKSFCDKAMAENVESRDAAQVEIGKLEAEKSRDIAEKKRLTKEVADLAAAISALKKALSEATELRNEDKAENERTVSVAEEGKAGVELAIKILSEFYGSAALMQTKYVPPNSDREGKTVGDRAPEVWSGEYHGAQTASKGILGILEVILSDFSRTIDTTNEEEAMDQADFEEYESDTNKEMDLKSETKKTKEERIVEIEDEITTGEDSLLEQNGLLKTAKETLSELKSQCVDGEETYAERVQKREEEIKALKAALVALEEWQK